MNASSPKRSNSPRATSAITYGSALRSVLLLNDRRDLTTYPSATEPTLRYSLNALGRVMNRDEDVLILALSSHGSPDATIDVSNEGLEPQPLSAARRSRNCWPNPASAGR